MCATQSFVARGALDETRLGRADGRGGRLCGGGGAVVRRQRLQAASTCTMHFPNSLR
jgi:hypothetical protein